MTWQRRPLAYAQGYPVPGSTTMTGPGGELVVHKRQCRMVCYSQ